MSRSVVDQTAIETAGATGDWAILHVQQPFVGSKGAMEPHGVVQARHLHVVIQIADSVWSRGGIEQAPIGEISQDTLMQSWVVR